MSNQIRQATPRRQIWALFIKGKYFGQNPLFFPPLVNEIPLFLPCFSVKKSSNVEVCQQLPRSAENLYFLFSKLVTLNKNGKKTGEIGQITQKQGDFKGFLFCLQLNFFPVFWQGEFSTPLGVSFGQNIYPSDRMSG